MIFMLNILRFVDKLISFYGISGGGGGFPLQFGSISPGLMQVVLKFVGNNACCRLLNLTHELNCLCLQVPARTSSAPPNLDEQKQGQVCTFFPS